MFIKIVIFFIYNLNLKDSVADGREKSKSIVSTNYRKSRFSCINLNKDIKKSTISNIFAYSKMNSLYEKKENSNINSIQNINIIHSFNELEEEVIETNFDENSIECVRFS